MDSSMAGPLGPLKADQKVVQKADWTADWTAASMVVSSATKEQLTAGLRAASTAVLKVSMTVLKSAASMVGLTAAK